MMMTPRRCLVWLLFCLSFTAQSQSASGYTSSEILFRLQKLGTLGKVLYIAAHPDDENTRLLAYLANERKCRTAYLSLTRGDGGQNLIGKEQGEALGVIRTQELLAARKVDGAEQFFSTAGDFGYSKNPVETFSFWDHNKVLGEVVYLIRSFQPDVIICRFPTTGEGGHGHHTASAILANEAYEAAADSNRFPEQCARLKPWSTKRLFWNTFNFGSANTTSPEQLKLDVGGYNPLLGKSYGEIAAESRSCHKSQGFGVPMQRGENIEYFKQLKGDTVKGDILEGLPLNWSALEGAAAIEQAVAVCIRDFDGLHPEASVPGLLTVYTLLQEDVSDKPTLRYWKAVKRREAEELLLACSGLWLEANVSKAMLVPGQSITVNAQVISRSDAQVKLNALLFPDRDSLCNLALKTNRLYQFKHQFVVQDSTPFSSPYWLEQGIRQADFDARPEAEPPLQVKFMLNLHGMDLFISRPIVCKQTDPVKGELYKPVQILPPVSLKREEGAFVFVNGASRRLGFTVVANRAGLQATLELNGSKGWNAQPGQQVFKLENEGDAITLYSEIRCDKAVSHGTLAASLLVGDRRYPYSLQQIAHDHIPPQCILSPSNFTLVNSVIKTKALKLAYIEGAGDGIPLALAQLNYSLTRIKADDLKDTELKGFDAIITGIRAYNTNASLLLQQPKLLDYVKQGGNLIIQYNTNNNIGQLKSSIGPYPFTISRERITDERSAWRFVLPEHPALCYPNALKAEDFEAWVQERGIYFATDVDARYQTPLAMQDPDEKEKFGALIIAPYGKGNCVYTGLAFFRQLPAGVPGAYRLFVNLLHLPKH